MRYLVGTVSAIKKTRTEKNPTWTFNIKVNYVSRQKKYSYEKRRTDIDIEWTLFSQKNAEELESHGGSRCCAVPGTSRVERSEALCDSLIIETYYICFYS